MDYGTSTSTQSSDPPREDVAAAHSDIHSHGQGYAARLLTLASTIWTANRIKWWKLYAMYFLFTWNLKAYEYATYVMLFAVPNGVGGNSARDLVSTIFAIIFSSSIGHWIDTSPSRQRTLILSINFHNIATLSSYLFYLFWPSTPTSSTSSNKPFLFIILLTLNILQRLTSISTHLSLERDWVPTLVGPITAEMDYGLTHVNAVMLRIDLLCQIFGPLLFSLPLYLASNSWTTWVWMTVCFMALCWVVEVWLVKKIAWENEEIRERKVCVPTSVPEERQRSTTQYVKINSGLPSLSRKLSVLFQDATLTPLQIYFSSPIWQASMSIAILELIVFAYIPPFFNYLSRVGVPSGAVEVSWYGGVVFSFCGTVLVPLGVGYLRRAYKRRGVYGERGGDEVAEGKAVRVVGLVGVGSQFLSLIPVSLILLIIPSPPATDTTFAPTPHILMTLLLFTFLSLSRLFYFTYELAVLELEQVEIPASHRATFGGTEQSLKSISSLLLTLLILGCGNGKGFKVLVGGSLLVAGVSTGVFGWWMRMGIGKRDVWGGEVGGGVEGVVMGGLEVDEEDREWGGSENEVEEENDELLGRGRSLFRAT